jgi:hypothetical protein
MQRSRCQFFAGSHLAAHQHRSKVWSEAHYLKPQSFHGRAFAHHLKLIRTFIRHWHAKQRWLFYGMN